MGRVMESAELLEINHDVLQELVGIAPASVTSALASVAVSLKTSITSHAF